MDAIKKKMQSLKTETDNLFKEIAGQEEATKAANDIAKKPKILDVLKILPEFPAKPAIIAPTIITDEIAFVTDINGVCKAGVTDQTT